MKYPLLDLNIKTIKFPQDRFLKIGSSTYLREMDVLYKKRICLVDDWMFDENETDSMSSVPYRNV